ncbi:MAG: FkbM family methyltransferase [Pseudomonadota bacterium]
MKGLAEEQGYAIVSTDELTKLNESRRLSEFVSHSDFLSFLDQCKPQHVDRLLRMRGESTAQILQDLFVLDQLDFKTGGVFVEFGAANGLTFSNSLLLERGFEWTGVLAEPCRRWHNDLRANRSCAIDTRCIWSKSGEQIEFTETDLAELSTVSSLKEKDYAAEFRVPVKSYRVETLSLHDLIDEYIGAREIDYLSIDTEGSELEILSNFDFDARSIKVITCEHNFNENRESIRELLTEKGYTQRMAELSQFDDWYTRF